MKSRDLRTIHDVIITDYRITPLSDGKYLHQFRPATTDTVYEFEANSAPVLKNGDRYNIGFKVTPSGRNIIDTSALGKVDTVNKVLSYLAAKQLSADILDENTAKNDQRVSHTETNGYYWGKKYAWRRYGLVISKDAFYGYLEHIEHPFTSCLTSNPDLPYSANERSTAYLDAGLEAAMDALIDSAVKVGRYHESPLYPHRFQIKAINAITDKK